MLTIRRFSHYFQFLFAIIFITLPLVFLHTHLTYDTPFYSFPTTQGALILPLDLHSQKILTFLSILPLLMQMFITANFYRLFALYKKGDLFVTKSVNYVRRIGICLLIFLGFQPLTQAIMSFLLIQKADKHLFLLSISPSQVAIAIAGMVFIFISWLMKEANTIKIENESFI